jgi:hypothetical protein
MISGSTQENGGMNQELFIEAIQASASVAAAAVSAGNSAEGASTYALNPAAVAEIAAAAFNGCFNQITEAIANGHLDQNEYEEEAED